MRRLLLALAAIFLLTNAAPAWHDYRAADGVTLHYRELGSGPVIVLLAGGPGFSGDYMAVLGEKLSANYRVVIPEQRGTGKSSLETYDASTISLAKYLADLESLRAELHLEKLVLVGHSWGGMYAMTYAGEHPDRVQAMLLVDSGGPDLSFAQEFGKNLQANMTEEEKKQIAYWNDPERKKADPEKARFEASKVRYNAYFFDHAKAHLLNDTLVPGGFDRRVNSLLLDELDKKKWDARPALAKTHIPTLVIHGKQDPLDTAEIVHAAVPGSHLVLIGDCGHFPWLEQPELFYLIATDFLQRQGR